MKKEELTQSLEQETLQTLSVGEQFRQAREQLGLTLDAASKQLNLRPLILTYIENNEFSQKKIPATFMKGYVRNYARLLKLPENVWINAVNDFGATPKNDFTKVARTERVTNPHSHSRWVGYLTTIVIIFVVAMTALWWWENYQQSNTERDNLVHSYTEPSATSSSVSTEVPVAQPVVETQATTATTATTSKTSVAETSTISQSVEQAVPVETPKTTTPAHNEIAVVTMPITQSNGNDSNGNTQPETFQIQASQTATTPTVETAQPVAQNNELQIEVVSASSWISVKDANRKILAQKEYQQGEQLSFNSGAPYSLIIGAPANVKITYKGENYPLKVDGRIAKFKLQ